MTEYTFYMLFEQAEYLEYAKDWNRFKKEDKKYDTWMIHHGIPKIIFYTMPNAKPQGWMDVMA